MPDTPIYNFAVNGGKKLKGTVTVSGSKNGAMGILCASLLNRGTTTLHRMPKIEEVYRMLEIFHSIGITTEWNDSTLTIIPPKKLDLKKLDKVAAMKTRSIIMFIGPLLSHFASFSLPQSGGCKLGSRTVRPHFYALEKLGVSIEATSNAYKVKRGKTLTPGTEIIMYESGDTATENALMAAASVHGQTTIKYASANYMVQDLCGFLRALGVTIEGVGTTTLSVHGTNSIIHKEVEYTIGEDPTDAMFFLATAIVTKSAITIKRAPIDFLELELLKLEKMGFSYKASRPYLSDNGITRLVDITTTVPKKLTASPEKLYGRPYPGVNMDNLPFFAVIATQAEGTTLIHDWSYEKRAIYFTELEKLGAETLLADPHRVYITGPSRLKAAEVVSPSALRPATILLVAMLGAPGHSLLRNVYSIRRGYEDLAEKLRSLGADIELVE